jgi:hypothetical protein
MFLFGILAEENELLTGGYYTQNPKPNTLASTPPL